MPQDGTAFYELFTLIRENPIKENKLLDLPKSGKNDCCSLFQLNALASISNNDTLKNDISGFLFAYNNAVTGAKIYLQRYDSNVDAYIDVVNLTANTSFGTPYDFGFKVNSLNEKLLGYQLMWRYVLITFGSGTYRIKADYTTIVGDATEYSLEYCLRNYSAEIANSTIRFEYYNSGINGNNFDDTKVFDYVDLNWYNAYRLTGFFGYPESSYSNEYIKYESGKRVWVTNEQTPTYTCELYQLPSVMHDIMRTEIMQADRIIITDYNAENASVYIAKDVIHDGNYAPKWNILQSKVASVELKFTQGFNNLRKKRC